MKKITKRIFSFIMALGMILSLVPVVSLAADTPKVFILGDSTAETKKGNAEHLTGWGEVLHNFFSDPYMIKNYAVSGESSKHFYNGYWLTSIKGQVKKGDYVIIQFGHNDIKAPSVTGDMGETTTDWSYYTYPSDNLTDTDSNGCYSFGYYLNKYVTEVREAGGIPIFVTSIERRKDAYISADPAVSPHSQLAGYMAAMNSIASKLTVPVIDVYTQTRTEIVKNPIATLNPWYMSYHGGEDDTHLTEAGAMAVAKMVAEGIKASQDSNVKGLAAYLKASFDGITNVAPPFYIDTDFEGGSDGLTVSGYDNWFFTDNSNDKDIKYKKETLQDGTTNVYANFTSIANFTEYRALATLERSLTGLSSKYVHFSYMLRSDSANNGGFMSILNGTAGYTEFHTAINTSKVAGVSFKDSDGNAMTTGKWYRYDYYINRETGDLTLKVDGKIILRNKNYPNIAGLNQIRFAFPRTAAVVDSTAGAADAAVAIDNVTLYSIEQSEFEEVSGILPANVFIKEGFEDGYNGDAISSSISPGWSYGYTTNNGGSSYTATYWKETGVTPSNMAMLLENNDAAKQGLTQTTNTLAAPVTEGYVHLSWKTRSVGTLTADATLRLRFNGTVEYLYDVNMKNLEPDKWYKHDVYYDIAKQEMTIYRDKTIVMKQAKKDYTSFSVMGFSMYRKHANYKVAIDDIIAETISQEDYNDIIGVLAENVIFSEKGNFVASGTALATSATEATNLYSNFYAPSDGKEATWIKFADSPIESGNTAINFGRTIANPRNGSELMKRDISPALTDGFYSLSLKLHSVGENNARFRIGAIDDAGQNCYLELNFKAGKAYARTYYPTSAGLSSSEGDGEEISCNSGWNDIEILFDLRATDHCKLTLYVNGSPVLSNVNWGYYPSFTSQEITNPIKNNGSIKQIYMGVYGDLSGSNTSTDPADISWFADDLLFQKVEAKVSAVTVTDGKLASVKFDLGWIPTASQKVVVAAYSTDASGNITTLKDSQVFTAGKGVQTLNITDDISVNTGDVIKVFFWNMNTLIPYMASYTQSIS